MMKYSIENSIEILEQTPKTLMSMLGNLSDEWINCNEGEDTWSAFDIVGHLIHCENTDWIPRLKLILSKHEDKTFEPFDRFAQFENSKGKSFSYLLEEFHQLRAENLEYLKMLELSRDQLLLKGKHPVLGEVRLKELLAAWVTHDLGHISQISRVMAKQYKNEVGPWTAFISILNT